MDPIGHFCKAVGMLPEKEQLDVIYHCGFCVGVKERRNDVEWSDHVPIGTLYHKPTLEELEGRIRDLTDGGVETSFVIKGLLNHLIESYEDWADPASTSEAIDRNLSMRQWLLDELGKPVDERKNKASDELLRGMLSKHEEGMGSVPEGRAKAEKMLDVFVQLRDQIFTKEYWNQYERHEISKLKP